MTTTTITLNVNGRAVETTVEPRELLIHVLRDRLDITGPHIGCETSHCGACTVDIDGRSVKACTLFAVQAQGSEITTIEGLGSPDKLHVLQEQFKEHHGLQCGFCTPGMITRAHRLLEENPNPTEQDVRFGIAGNLCRCTGYQNIVKAVLAAASEINAARKESTEESAA